jgi:hypothetical protein
VNDDNAPQPRALGNKSVSLHSKFSDPNFSQMADTIIISVGGEDGESSIQEDDVEDAAFDVRACRRLFHKLSTALTSHLSFTDSK